ncbi:MAG: aldo/keto reductase [Candidatus Lokiarchaeota archaeon]|nr:aldo/keto reductase [Candidatus Lokiarchaeota archaeon]
MKYRKMGSLGWEVSALGFGAMRLPVNKETKEVNEKETIEMIRYAIDNGVNYVDTAYPYHDGKSEVIVGKALKEGYREKVTLTTKLPIWIFTETSDFNLILSEQIERLQTTPDIYLFHGLNKGRLEKVKKLGLITKMEEARANGLIRYIGFSFHDSIDAFKEIIDYYDWDCCQIQLNYTDVNYQAGLEGLEYAGKKGIAVIIMEPLRGGKLTVPKDKLIDVPEIKKVLDDSEIKRSMADWGLQFLWNRPEVSVVLSGMSNLQQVKENVQSADKSGINSLTNDELKIIRNLQQAFEKYHLVPCTSCGYCMPCPNGVSIKNVIYYMNEVGYWGENGKPRVAIFYNYMAKTQEELEKKISEGADADGSALLCIDCGECLDKCPQQIDIPKFMKQAVAIFEEDKKVSEVLD